MVWSRRSIINFSPESQTAIETLTPVEIKLPVRNVHRSVGTMLSGAIARRHGSAGLPDDTIRIHLDGSAGQSLGAFLAKGVTLTLEGDANDYVGKGLSGGRLIVYPPRRSSFAPENKYSHWQRRSLRRDQRRGVFQWSRGRALCRSQLRSDRGGRGRRRPLLRIHDQGLGAGARSLRQKFCRRHEWRRRLRFRRARRLHRKALQSGVG